MDQRTSPTVVFDFIKKKVTIVRGEVSQLRLLAETFETQRHVRLTGSNRPFSGPGRT